MNDITKNVMTPSELRIRYNRGENIAALLRARTGVDCNLEEFIELSYDLQAGSYVAAMADDEFAHHKQHYGAAIAQTIRALSTPASILEAGVGEATTLCSVLQCLPRSTVAFGFDLSWSRVAVRQALASRTWVCLDGALYGKPVQYSRCLGCSSCWSSCWA
jgi:hypothetical protein